MISPTVASPVISITTTQPSSSTDPCTVNPSSAICAPAVMDDESGIDTSSVLVQYISMVVEQVLKEDKINYTYGISKF